MPQHLVTKEAVDKEILKIYSDKSKSEQIEPNESFHRSSMNSNQNPVLPRNKEINSGRLYSSIPT